MSSRRREHRAAPPPSHPDTYSTRPPALHGYYTDHEPERRRRRPPTLPAHGHEPRYYESKPSDRLHPPAAPSASYNQPVPAPSTSRSHQSKQPAKHPTPNGYQYHQAPSYHPAAPSQPPPASHAATATPLATSSRRPYGEASDSRGYSHRITTSAPPIHSAFDLPDPAKPPRHRATHSSTQHTPTTHPNHAAWVPPSQQMPSTRRPVENGRDREEDRGRAGGRTRGTERPPAESGRDGYPDKSKLERHRERERAPEPDRYKEYREPGRSRPRNESDPDALAYTDRAISHGRYRVGDGNVPAADKRHLPEDLPVHSSSTRRHAESNHNAVDATQQRAPQANSTTQNRQGSLQSSNQPLSASRLTSGYHPQKATTSQRSHPDKRLSVVAHAQGGSGSDTERPSVNHRTETSRSATAAQSTGGYGMGSMRDKGSRDVPIGPRGDVKDKSEGKYGPQNTRQPFAQVNTDTPVSSGYRMQTVLPDNPVGSTVPQFVSIRASQGPSDPQAYDAFKPQFPLRSDDPQIVASNYLQPTSASIKPSYRVHPVEIARSHSDQPMGVRSRIDSHGVELSAGPHASSREAGQVMPTPMSRAASQQARGNPETSLDDPDSAYLTTSYPVRPPSRTAQRISSAYATPPAVAGPRPLRSGSQGPQTVDLPTRSPSVAPIPASTPNQHSIPSSPAYRADPDPASINHPHTSSVHPIPKNAQSNSYHDTYYRPQQIQRSTSGPSSTHHTPSITPQIISSSSQHSRHTPYLSSRGDERHTTLDTPFETRHPIATHGGGSPYTVQGTPASSKNNEILREDKYMHDRQPNSGLVNGVHRQLREVLSQDDDPYPRVTSSMMKASLAATPPSASHRTPPYSAMMGIHTPSSRGASVANSPHSWHKQAPTPEQSRRRDLQSHQPSPNHLGPPQIAIVGATPDNNAQDLPSHVDHALLAPPDPTSTRESKPRSGRESRTRSPRATHDEPALSQLQLSAQIPLLHVPLSSSPLVSEVETGDFSPPPLPVPPPRGLEDSPLQPIETRYDEIMPARLQDEEVEEVADRNFTSASHGVVRTPSSTPSFDHPMASSTASQSPWQSSGVEGGGIHQAPSLSPHHSHRTDAWSSKNPITPSRSAEGASRAAMQAPFSAAHAKVRPKVTVEEAPESPINNTIAAHPLPVASAPPLRTATTVTPQTSTGHSAPSVAPRPATATVRTSPPSRTKDSLSRRPAEPVSGPSIMPTIPPAPITHASSSRAPFSAPPSQETFLQTYSPSAHQHSQQRSVSQSATIRPAHRSVDIAQTTKSSMPPSGTSTSHAIPPTTQSIAGTQTSGGVPFTTTSRTAPQASHGAVSATMLYALQPTAAPPVSSGVPSGTPSRYAQPQTSGSFPSTTEGPPSVVPPASGTVPPVTATSRNATSTTHTAQALASTKPPVSVTTTSNTYTTSTTAAHPTRPSVTAVNGTQQPAGSQQYASSAAVLPSTMPHNTAPPAIGPQVSSTTKPPVSTSAQAATHGNTASVSHVNKGPISATQATGSSAFTTGAVGLQATPSVNGTSTQPNTVTDTHKHSSRHHAVPQASSQYPPATVVSSSTKIPNPDHPPVDSTRSRDTISASRNLPSSSQAHNASVRPGPSTIAPQQSHQPAHNRTASLPTTQAPPVAAATPPSPRKSSQPIPTTSISAQPFPSKSSPPQTSHAPAGGHVATPAPPRTRLPLDRTMSHDSEMLRTPSSIAQSPMPQVRPRQLSTESKDSTTKRQQGFFKLFKPKPGSKPYEGAVPSPLTGTLADQQKTQVETPSSNTPQNAVPPLTVKEPKERAHAQQSVTSAPAQPISSSQPRSKNRPRNSTVPPVQPSTRERKDSTTLFTPFKFLAMHSRRHRTMSGASLDVCDGNTATNTVMESPAQSVVSPSPFPPLIPPPVQDPMDATRTWRDREEAQRREKKAGKVRRPRPGVTFDLGEDPPEPPQGVPVKKGPPKPMRRKSGRGAAPSRER